MASARGRLPSGAVRGRPFGRFAINARQRDPGPAETIMTPDALRLRHAPIADCARYDQLTSARVRRFAVCFAHGALHLPIQLLVLGRLPLVFARRMADYKVAAASIVVYYAAVMFVWLNFAADASDWVPYSIIDADRLVGLSY